MTASVAQALIAAEDSLIAHTPARRALLAGYLPRTRRLDLRFR